MILKYEYVVINENFEAYISDEDTFNFGSLINGKVFENLDLAKMVCNRLNGIDYPSYWRVIPLKYALIESINYLSNKGNNADYNSINNGLYMHNLFRDINSQIKLLRSLENIENSFS